MTLESLNCPNCGAPLPDPQGRVTVMCTHCHTVVRVAPAKVDGAPTGPPHEPAPFTPKAPIPKDVSARLIELLRAGRRLEAIEYYQTASQVGEAEAKDVVDAIQAGLPAATQPTGVADVARIQQLLGERRRTYAIQLYREQTGVTLSDAAKAVDAIAAGREPPPVVRAGVRRLAAEDIAQVRSLLERGNKVEAIKFYRERMGAGLNDAKAAVEAMARGGDPPDVAMAQATHPALAGADLARIQNLLKVRSKIEAIKLYRQLTGVGLKEAKDAVEAIAASTPGVPADMGKSDNRGCWNILLVIAAFVTLLLGGCGAVAQTTGTYRCVVAEAKRAAENSELLGQGVNAGYLVLAPGYSQSWDFDGSWRLSMNLFMPAWGSRGLGWLYVTTSANDSGYTAMRTTLFADWGRHVLQTWGQIDCGNS